MSIMPCFCPPRMSLIKECLITITKTTVVSDVTDAKEVKSTPVVDSMTAATVK